MTGSGSGAAEAVSSIALQFWSIFVRIKPKILRQGRGRDWLNQENVTFKNNEISWKIESHPLRQAFFLLTLVRKNFKLVWKL